jgi:hypothetical protein
MLDVYANVCVARTARRRAGRPAHPVARVDHRPVLRVRVIDHLPVRAVRLGHPLIWPDAELTTHRHTERDRQRERDIDRQWGNTTSIVPPRCEGQRIATCHRACSVEWMGRAYVSLPTICVKRPFSGVRLRVCPEPVLANCRFSHVRAPCRYMIEKRERSSPASSGPARRTRPSCAPHSH